MRPFQRDARRQNDLSEAIYASLVASLYGDPRTLLIGSMGTVASAFLTAFTTQSEAFLACAIGMTVVALLRANDLRLFRARVTDGLDMEAAHRWEQRYVLGASAYVLVMGVWCFLAFAMTADPWIQLLCFSMTLVNMIGVAGRNYGSPPLVVAQLFCAGIPMFLGLIWGGDSYYIVVACVILPFFLSFKTIADRLRSTLTEAVKASKISQRLADRLDVALNTMAHGLCMFGDDGRIILVNHRLPSIVGLPAGSLADVRTLKGLFRRCLSQRLIDAAGLRQAAAAYAKRRRMGDESPINVELTDGRVIALVFRFSKPGTVVLVEDVTERDRMAAKISYLAHYDALTGLPNRALFRSTVARVMATMKRRNRCAILFVDLDHFKQVNDTLGHPSGDELLKQVAVRLRALLGRNDSVARWGGDEFVLLRPRIETMAEVTKLAESIVKELELLYHVDGHDVVVGASVGIAIGPRDGADTDVLLKNADLALYRAKAEGRGAWRIFEPDMDVQARARRQLELDLRASVEGGKFELLYQPIVNTRLGRITTCEALLRWHHPERGLLQPSEFIPVAEEMGIIVELGEVVLRMACIEASAWPAGVRVAINLSAMQFRRGNIVETIRKVVRETGFPFDRIEVEITETVLLQDHEAAMRTLGKLRALGVRISLDDFGTGYSSLSYLQTFPLHKVKIDRSFLQGIGDSNRSQILLRGVARLCRELGMTVVIEGVEDHAQLELIADNEDIEEVQGYLLGRPASAARTRELLAAFDISALPKTGDSRSAA